MKQKIVNKECLEYIRTLPDKCIDLVYTDVPYDLEGNDGGGCFGEKKRDYHQEYYNVSNNKNAPSLAIRKSSSNSQIAEIAFGFDERLLDELVRVMKKIYIYIWCSKKQIPMLFKYFEKYNCFYDVLVWCKTNPIPTCNGTYLSDIEYCLLFREKGTKIYGEYATKHKYYVSSLNTGDKKLWEHPTIKPLPLVKNHIYNCLPPDINKNEYTVLDPFSGSGTTGVACKELGINYIGCEINEHWFEISQKRINETKSPELSLEDEILGLL